MTILTGTAGWSIPKAIAPQLPGEGTHLERYARVMPAVEINSSFYRPHQPTTYARWAAATPDDFRFAVKLPREITHTHRLADIDALLDAFAAQTTGLGDKFESVLVQLPPSLAFDPSLATTFFATLAARLDVAIACEPRHPSWFTDDADHILAQSKVARVAADPPKAPGGDRPGGWTGLHYHRLHGSPRVYYSPYGEPYVQNLAKTLQSAKARRSWCIFDNTASGAALSDATTLNAILQHHANRS